MSGKPKKRAAEMPKGWSEKRVKALVDHYENQTDDDALAEDEAARKGELGMFVFVPAKKCTKCGNSLGARIRSARQSLPPPPIPGAEEPQSASATSNPLLSLAAARAIRHH